MRGVGWVRGKVPLGLVRRRLLLEGEVAADAERRRKRAVVRWRAAATFVG